MPLTIVTSWQRLMMLAHELGQARLSGDPEAIQAAEETHEHYKQLVLRSDRTILPHSSADLLAPHARPLAPNRAQGSDS